MRDGVHLKRFVCALFVFLMIFSANTGVFAAKPECSLSLPKEFTVKAQSDELEPLADIFGIKPASLQKYYKDNNVLYLAANEENTCQVTLTAVKNEFSEGAVSFSRLSDTELEAVASDLAGESFENCGIVKSKDGNRFIKLKRTMSDSGGEYTVTEFITVCSYKLFTMSVSVSNGSGLEKMPNTALEGLEIADYARPQSSSKGFIFTALAAIGIAIFATVAVYFTVTVIRDIRKK